MAVNRTESHDLKNKFEAVHYAIDDILTPADSTLKLLFDQIEHGEWRPLLLVQFLSREDAETEPLGAVIDKTGSVKIKKGYAETAEPKNAEELRTRMRIVAHAYIMAAMKYPQKAQLQVLGPHHFLVYADYLLGRQVAGLKAKDPDGNVVSMPPFTYVLAYDHQVRKEMAKLMNEGKDIVTALDTARKDVTIRERYFITPASMSALTSSQSRWKDPGRHNAEHGMAGHRAHRDQLDGKGQRQSQGQRQRKQRKEAAQPHTRWKRDMLQLEQPEGKMPLQLRQSALLPDLLRQPPLPYVQNGRWKGKDSKEEGKDTAGAGAGKGA